MSLRGSLCDILWEGQHRQLLALADISKTRDAELQVMQAAKLATLGEMATAIAHETNQPLAVIKMAVANAERLVANGADGDAVTAKLTRISDQVDRIKRITDQVRRYGRMASRQEEPFDLHNAIGLAIGFVAEQYRAAGIRLKIDLDLPPALTVAGEQTMFEQVIVNILVNARDAFESRRDGAVAPLVVVHAVTAGNSVVIIITDNAGGIRADMVAKVFEPFATTKPDGQGTGLGLSMSRSIVRDMRGDIDATNEGDGAMFTIRLPIAGIAVTQHQAA
jgi:C4-dicarboxylate-specific signal transduction histidine kinase